MCYYLNVQFQGQRVHIHGALTEGQTEEAWEPSIKQCLKRTVAGLSPRRPGFHSRPVYVRFVQSLEQGFPRLLLFSPVSITAKILHTHLHRNTTLLKGTGHRNVVIFKQRNALSTSKAMDRQNTCTPLLYSSDC